MRRSNLKRLDRYVPFGHSLLHTEDLDYHPVIEGSIF